jgi:hypothetical protein
MKKFTSARFNMPKKAKYYTNLEAAWSGEEQDHIYAIAISHRMPDPIADLNSYVIDLNLGGIQPTYKILINGDKAMFPEYPSCFACMAKTSDSILYIGEDDGFIRYQNGKSEIFNYGKGIGISNCVYLGSDKSVVFGTSRGEVVHVNDREFRIEEIAAPAKRQSGDANVEAIHGIGSNFMVAVGESGLVSRYRDGAWERIKPPSNAFLESVWCRSETEIYVGAKRGLAWRWDGGSRWKKLKVDFAHGNPVFDFSSITEYQGTIYAACSEHGIYWLNGDTWVAIPEAADKTVCFLRETTSGLIGLGAVWGDSGSWLTRFDGETWTRQQIHVDPV